MLTRTGHPTRGLRRLASVCVVVVLAAACSPGGSSSPSVLGPTGSAGASAGPETEEPAATASAPTSSSAATSSAPTSSSAATSAGTGSSGTSPGASAKSSSTATKPFDPTGVQLTTSVVVDGLSSPVDVTSARDGSGRLFVVEQAGRIRIVKDGKSAATPFLDITDRIASGGERGLLGLAFHPDFPKDPRFFVDYTDRDGNTVVSEFTVPAATPDQADKGSERVLLHQDQPFANHNGGAIAFGNDGMLYISFGDGGSANDPRGNGQNLGTLLAKILRIDVAASGGATPYTVPPDNPFVGKANAKPEIWLSGLRNPWRMRFDRPTGDLWIGDVGQDAWEEVDVARAGTGGQNYGWNVMEGFHCFNPQLNCDQTGLTLPVAEYAHDAGCAIIGGVVVHDATQPRMDGGYIFSDSCSGTLWMLDPVTDAQGRSSASVVGQTGASVSAIDDDENGTVYLTDLQGGKLLKVSAKE